MGLIKNGKALESVIETINELMKMGEENISLISLKILIDKAKTDEFNRALQGDEVAEELSDFVNSAYQDQKKGFITTVLSDHRTLQSDTFNLFYKCFEGWADNYDSGNFDGRNEGACKLAHMMIKAVE